MNLPATVLRVDRFQLYDACVIQPISVVTFLRKVHGAKPRTLRVDFAVTATLANTWVTMVPSGAAISVPRFPLKSRQRADVIAATNFSIGNLLTRDALLAYLVHARATLQPRGIFVADLYGGTRAFLTGLNVRMLDDDVEFTFEQRRANPFTGMVENALHFRVGEKALLNVFVFKWRLWSAPELAAAASEAGFSAVRVHDGLSTRPLSSKATPDDNWVIHLVARR